MLSTENFTLSAKHSEIFKFVNPCFKFILTSI